MEGSVRSCEIKYNHNFMCDHVYASGFMRGVALCDEWGVALKVHTLS